MTRDPHDKTAFFEETRDFNGQNGIRSSQNGRIQKPRAKIGSKMTNLHLLDPSSSSSVSTVKSIINAQLVSKPRIDQQSQFTELYSLMKNTVSDHAGNSTIVIGPRGSGKTNLINQCLAKLEEQYPKEFLTIRLNSFIHSDDNAAIREVGTQLSKIYKDRDVDAQIESHQLTATFNNILSILDRDDIGDDEVITPIIFVIDELETFTSGNKQVLLYNLFEFTQSSKTPICVVGTSTRFTTRELLEKRVRSRFSQRLIIMNKFVEFDAFVHACCNNIKLEHQAIDQLDDPDYGHQWNDHIDQLISNKSHFYNILLLQFHTTKSVKLFNQAAILPVSKVNESNPFINDELFTLYYKLQMRNPVQGIIESVSNLQLVMIIAAARFINKSNMTTINFSIAYQEYVDMMKQFNLDKTIVNSSSVTKHDVMTSVKIQSKVRDPEIMKSCWLTLYRLGIVIDYVPNTSEGGVRSANSNKYLIIEDTRMLQLDISLEEINQYLSDQNPLKPLTRL